MDIVQFKDCVMKSSGILTEISNLHEMTDAEEKIFNSLDWTDEETAALLKSITAGGRVLVPLGVNRHFHMIGIQKKFQAFTKKQVDTKLLWAKLGSMYDLPKLETQSRNCPFPLEQTEFSLPEGDFSQLIRDRKGQSSSSQDKMMDDESRDSESGRETPPTLPIAKRSSSIQSSIASNKRKHSTSFSDTGSEGGSSTAGGRKSSSNTPTGNNKKRSRI